MKLALHQTETFIGRNTTTEPEVLGRTPLNHFVVSSKVKDDKIEDLVKFVENGNLNSWNIVAVTVGDARKVAQVRHISPINTRHKNCKYPGYGPI